jgi:hypothetical protein
MLVFFEFTAVAAEYVCPEVNGAPVEVNVNGTFVLCLKMLSDSLTHCNSNCV